MIIYCVLLMINIKEYYGILYPAFTTSHTSYFQCENTFSCTFWPDQFWKVENGLIFLSVWMLPPATIYFAKKTQFELRLEFSNRKAIDQCWTIIPESTLIYIVNSNVPIIIITREGIQQKLNDNTTNRQDIANFLFLERPRFFWGFPFSWILSGVWRCAM